MTDFDDVFARRIGDAIKQMITYLLQASTDDFTRNKMLQDAILHQLEIAGQSSRDLSFDFRQKHKGMSCAHFLGVGDSFFAVTTNNNEAVDNRAVGPPQSLADVERKHIKKTLAYTGGNRTRAAKILGISRIGLISKIRDYEL